MTTTPSIAAFCQSVAYRVTLYATLAGLISLLALLYYATSSEVAHEQERLTTLAPQIGRSISGEIFVDDGRSLKAILPEVARKFSLEKVEVGGEGVPSPCSPRPLSGIFSGNVCQTIPLAVAGRNLPVTLWSPLSFSFRRSLFVVGLLSLLGVAGLGILIARQTRRSLEESLVKPLEALAANPERLRRELSGLAEVAKIQGLLGSYVLSQARQKQLEEKAERDQDLGQIALRASHDIRSPLFALKVLSEDLTSATEPQRRRLLAAVERINAIASDLLATSHSVKIASATRAWDVVQEIIAEKRFELRHRPLLIECECEPAAENLELPIAANELKRMLSNLMNNAAEAIETHGRIKLRQRLNGSHVVWELADDGKGIPPEIVPQVLHGMSYGKTEGHGLGLSSARKLVESSQGELTLFSEPGKGTTVRILLPQVNA